MSAYGRTFFEFCAMPALAGHLGEKQPAWLWSADGRRVLWANAAGVRFFRAASMAELLGRSLADTAPARRHLERLAHAPQDRETLERLRFFIGVRAVQVTAHARALTLTNGEQAALVVATDTRLDIEDPLAEFCRLLAGEGYSAFLTDEDGKVLASAGAIEPGIVSLEEADDEIDVLVRIADDLHAARMAQLSDPAPAACLIIAWDDVAQASAQEPDEIEAEPVAPEVATVPGEAGVETAGSPEEEAQSEDEAAHDAPSVDGLGSEEDVALSQDEESAGPDAGIVPEDDIEAEVVPMRAHAIPGEETEAVATSSFPRNFFPWPRFLKGRGHPRDVASSAAQVALAEPDADRPATDLIAQARAAKQILIDREHEQQLVATERLEEVSAKGSEDQPADDPHEDGPALEDAPQEPRDAQEVDEVAIFETPGSEVEERDGLQSADAETGETVTLADTGAPAMSGASDAPDDEGVADVFAAPSPDTEAEPDVAVLDHDGKDLPIDDREGVDAEGRTPSESLVEPEEQPTPAFAFDSDGRPVRFVWQMNASHVFTGVSPELAHVIGEEAADIVGRSWPEVAERLDLDPEGRVAAALSRRDTWSGLTVEWPVTDNPVVVPVDLAALPAFDRFRQFEGYRGFGVCRPADAVTMERMHQIPAFLAEEEEAPNIKAPLDADLTREAAAPARSEAVAMAASAAAIAGAELLADAEVDNEGETESREPDTARHEAPVPENPKRLSEAQESASDTETDLEAAEPKDPQGAGSVTDMPKLSQPAPAYAHYSPNAGHMPDWGLPEAANSQDHSENSPSSARDEENAVPRDEANSDNTAAGMDESDDALASDDVDEVRDEPVELAEGEVAAVADDLSEMAEPDETRGEPEDESEALQGEPDPELAAGPELATEPEPETEPEPVAEDESHGSVSSADATDASGGDDTVKEASGEEDAASREHDATQEAEPFLPMEGMSVSAPEEPSTEGDAVARDDADEIGEDPIAVDGTGGETGDGAQAEAGESFTETVVRLAERQVIPPDSQLTRPEREAFRKIAEALGARIDETNEPSDDEDEIAAKAVPPIPMPIAPRPQPRAPENREETAEEKAAAIHPRLLDRLPIGVAIVRDRDVEYANRSLLKMLGYADLEALAEAGGLEALFAAPDEWPPKPAGSATIEQSLCVRGSDGALHPVDAFMHTVPWKSASALMISLREKSDAPKTTAVSTDEVEAANERVAELEAILETATDGVMVLDAHGRILSVNRSGEALFNASRQRMTGALITDYLAPESHRSALDYLDGLARNGVASVLNDGREVIGQLSDGGLIPLFMTIGRIGQHTNRENTKFCAVLRDITQWKKAEEELTSAKRQAENASSQKSDFLAKISHEIRTPLNAIIGFSEVMMDERFGAVGNERYKDYLKDIHASGSHLLSLINDLLDLSKVEAGKFELAFEAVPINDVLRDCVALMQPQANRDRVIIRASLPTSVPKVVADPRSVRQIVLNLLSNAIKFNHAGGQVIVSTALEPTGEVVLRVRDTGMGMSRKDIEAALEPFRQLHTARLGGGTGLGLPLTKALVEANRAGFSIDSEPNQGTMVEITFPSQRVLAE
ncbi:ATP-binding protein [Breoghania sp.]|uniref:PAS domain-containing sensor histidine kinase n=1 Tax=Breoghania sp. TaxID=2065378 RepID=UPI002AAA697D|nr:ATP-binding protein [Breoghania sp.]